MSALPNLPESSRHKAYLELADYAKRLKDISSARGIYSQVTHECPKTAQGWLEYSKMEEEEGRSERAFEILIEGLSHCSLSEGLLIKAIKHKEKWGKIDEARVLLSRLKKEDKSKVWRTILEGALLESRAGRMQVARRVFKYLMAHVPWYGPIYYEAFRIEEKAGDFARAREIVKRGLKEIPMYGPLWFGAFRIGERSGGWQSMVEEAIPVISKELVWKVYYEAAMISERSAMSSLSLSPSQQFIPSSELSECRLYLAKAAFSCPKNFQFKVWLAGGRMEMNAGRVEASLRLFKAAYTCVPEKSKAVVLLECAKMEEYRGNLVLARAMLCKARYECRSDWKVWMESVFMEIRAGNRDQAIALAEAGIEKHRDAGRLWAIIVHLKEKEGEESQLRLLERAINEVPKSGEVWCEGAR